MASCLELTTEADAVRVFHGDSRDVLKTFPDNHFDSVVCDPPYALVSITKRFGAENAAPAQVGASGAYARASAGFMGQKWDTGETAFAVTFWAEVMRVLKPGGHVIAFSGTRTYHRLAVAIEDAGFEIRDMVAWLYGSGFPKSHDVSKGIDKARKDNGDWLKVGQWLRAERERAGLKQKEVAALWPSATGGLTGCVANWELGLSCPKWDQWEKLKARIGFTDDMDAEVWRLNGRKGTPGEAWQTADVVGECDKPRPTYTTGNIGGEAEENTRELKAANSDAARQWQGWGTALKPALEPVVLARKPLGTGAANVLENVERAIRSAGYEGEIVWKPEPANAAAKSAPRRTSSSTEQPPAAVTSADPADAFETENDGPQTVKGSAPTGSDGLTPILNETRTDERPQTPGFDPKSSPHTGASASAAARTNLPSSPSTTSKAAEPSIGSESTARSMPNCDDSASPATAIDSFAGTATGLSGSMAHVHIRRDKSGAFLWPANLPKSVPSTSLTVAANVLQHGTGALNIDASRIAAPDGVPAFSKDNQRPGVTFDVGSNRTGEVTGKGRWPANVIHDGSEEVTGAAKAGGKSTGRNFGQTHDDDFAKDRDRTGHDDAGGSAARFFYSAKADAEDRLGSKHPTVKPVDLMAYLVRLVTPPGGLTLDPFAGSGSTGLGAMREGMRCVLIEREDAYVADIMRKLAWAKGEGRLTALEVARLDTPEKQAEASGAGLPLFG